MKTSDLRIETNRPLIPPSILLEELPLSEDGSVVVAEARETLVRILDGRDDRLFVVVGPCSIHDPAAGLDYARRLKALSEELASELYVVMRVYFEKPRTTVGWKGLINDPHLDGTCRSNEGLRLARRLLLDLVELGVPSGCEFLDPISPQFISDLVVWGAIGARTTESQVHRQLASGLSMPIGFKNATDGRVQPAVDAMLAAANSHSFFGVTEQGLAAIVTTRGNADTHVILRGGQAGTNYDAGSVAETLAALDKAGLPRRLMIDTSHGNSSKGLPSPARRRPGHRRAGRERRGGHHRRAAGKLHRRWPPGPGRPGQPDLRPEHHRRLHGLGHDRPVLRELAASVRARRGARSPPVTSRVDGPSAELEVSR
jgi:3-deoxy-7-phosphoheptulonate synthase